MHIKELFVESRRCPLGIDITKPALSWSFEGSVQRSIIQTAYRIIVSEDEQVVHSGQGDVWDSGKVVSRKSVNILYEGCELQSRKRYFWKIQVWDQNGYLSESDVSWWEMGLLHPTDWSGKWIGQSEIHLLIDEKSMPMFRYEFNLDKPVRKARIYICGLGQYELRLNGRKVEDRVLDPGWTNYDKRCLYAVFDVTDQMQMASNTVGVILGNGFFNVTGGRYTKFKDSFGLPKCLVQIEVEYTDGTLATICSNREWMTSQSPITFSCMYGGEDYDARREQPGWDEPGFTINHQWENAAEVEPPSGTLKSQKSVPLKVMKSFKPVDIMKLKQGGYVVDFGQNFSGWVKISIKGRRNAEIKMIPAELLNEDGTANQKWTGSPYELNYVLKGDGIEVWNPRFSYYGFRYVQIEGAAPEGSSSLKDDFPLLVDIEGQMIYPEIDICGSFESSDMMLNKIHEIIIWAILSNMKSVFTDCPHREKLGWLEEVHLMGPSILYNYPVEPLLTKVMEDIQDSQLPNGMVPTTAPEYVVFEDPWGIFRHSVSWGATYVLNAWNLYQKYGNTRVLIDHYEGMKKYIDFVTNRSEDLIVKDGLGDWYDIGVNGPGFAQNTPVPLTETAMFYHIVSVLQKMAVLLDNTHDAEYYLSLSEKIKSKYNQTFFNPTSYQYATGSQASNAMSLALGLVEDENRTKVFHNLLEDIYANDYHTTSGDVAHRYVLLALAQHDRSDIIFEMTRKTDYPSYGYQIVNGATTLTEAWDGPTVGKSQNHFMLGHLEEWLYSRLAGINYEFNPATEAFQFSIKPHVEKQLNHVRAQHDLLVGQVRVEWKCLNGHHLKLDVHIPANCSGIVYIPVSSIDVIQESGKSIQEAHNVEFDRYENGYAVLRINSGLYHFESI